MYWLRIILMEENHLWIRQRREAGPYLRRTAGCVRQWVNTMKTWGISLLLAVFVQGISAAMAADDSARVTEAVNQVEHGSKASGKETATVGTEVRDELVRDDPDARTAVRQRRNFYSSRCDKMW